jgi:hypothetical protein
MILLLALEQRGRQRRDRSACNPSRPGPLRAALGGTSDWQRRYRGFIEAGADEQL